MHKRFIYKFQQTFKKGVFPERLKMAKITPIFRKGDSLLNYDLQCFSKILGKLTYNELYIYLAEKNILFCEQIGFWAGCWTDHAIIEIVDEITNDFMENKNTVGIFIDLSEGFETVNQKLLIEKLEMYVVKD